MLIPLATWPAHPRYCRLTPQVASPPFLPGLINRPDHQAAAPPPAPGRLLQPGHREPAHHAHRGQRVPDRVIEQPLGPDPASCPRSAGRCSTRCARAVRSSPRPCTCPPAATAPSARSTAAAAPAAQSVSAAPARHLSWRQQPPLIVYLSHRHGHEMAALTIHPSRNKITSATPGTFAQLTARNAAAVPVRNIDRIFKRKRCDADGISSLRQACGDRLDSVQQADRPTAAEAPGMGSEPCPIEVSDCDPAIIPARVIDVLDDRCPDDSLRRIFGTSGLTTNAQDCAYS